MPTQAPPLSKLDGVKALRIQGDAESLVLDVPMRSQYDSSPYQNSNCGPASLAMVLQAYGLDVPTARIRALANQLQGTYGYNDGVALDYLQAIGQQAGLREEGLFGADGHYRQWAISDLIQEVRSGHPVITLVHYTSLPAHHGEVSPSDHYVVVVGVTDKGFLINDPASEGSTGYRQLLTPPELIAAWKAASIPEQAVAFLPPTGSLVLNTVDGKTNSGSAGGSNQTRPVASLSRLAAAPSATSTPAPTVDPALLEWANTLKEWTHSADVPMRQMPPPAVSVALPTASAVASPERMPPGSPMPILGVLAAIGIGAVGVIKGTSN